jgi:hydroxymethylglutaryl-CoA lyase
VSSNLVKIVECPRDAWQALPHYIPAKRKAEYLRALIAAGFSTLDAVSFVSPTRVPQVSDSEEVLKFLNPPPEVEVIGIVVNMKGATRAVDAAKVSTMGYPHSISSEFLRRNQSQSRAESFEVLSQIAGIAKQNSIGVIAYVSMAFGNPYGEPWSVELVVDACQDLIRCGVNAISLADTTGTGSPEQIADTFGAVRDCDHDIQLGVHLHSRPDEADKRIAAAYGAGCRRFDAALGGFGGCPFAQDHLVGNIATERLIRHLAMLGAELPPVRISDSLLELTNSIVRENEDIFHEKAERGPIIEDQA